MEKLGLKTPNFTDDNIQKIAEIFPNCITEGADGKGIDFVALKQELSSKIIEGNKERYQLTWPGKAESLVTANAPIDKTLRPDREESKDFDNTENLYIEGDNLEVLKLLQETYLNKIKMIYIDPPYNTGKDFVYKDNFTQVKAEYDEEVGNKDEEGGRLVSNPDSNGRYHSDWLSMMYPRLKLARNLLKDDGVILISINDIEVHNMRKMCDEIFGEDNFLECFIWVKKTAPNNVIVGSVHEYVLIYTKSIMNVNLYLQPRSAKDNQKYTNPDNDHRGRWMADNITSPAKGGRSTPSLVYELENPFTGEIYMPPNGRMWSVTKIEMLKKIEDGTVVWGKENRGRPMNKRFLSETRNGKVMRTLIDDGGSNSLASKEIQKLFNDDVIFETPKPVILISKLILLSSRDDDLILDFFSGSATTAHAVMNVNAGDNGHRKFIMAQIPEATDEKSEAYKAGYKTIAEIGKARIRRAGEKIKEGNVDTGFRVLKVDSSNMKDVYYNPDNTDQQGLLDLAKNIKEDRSHEDLLFQVLLDWGVDLTLRIERKDIDGNSVYFVDGDTLAACFEEDITEDFVKELAKTQPLRVVFRDSGFASDNVKINVEQIFKYSSEHTDIKVI